MTDQQKIREDALVFAIRWAIGQYTAEVVLDAAKKFEAYLTGEVTR